MELQFPTDYKSVLEKIDFVDPLQYGKTRNFINGDVTYLSPYISRGVISTRQVLNHMISKGYKLSQIESFVKELCWRDYFQRVGQVKDVNQDIKQPQHPVLNHGIPSAIVNTTSTITGIDQAIQQLYSMGYMHNHCRMYTASVVCNIANCHWLQPSKWMYYHLLDGDWASNACSWQWVAGANSNKKYIANQENINKYTNTNQANTFLDAPYEVIEQMETPTHLLATQELLLETSYPSSELLQPDRGLPTFVYNYYNLDPLWHMEEQGNRILLLEPELFAAYPISKRCMEFMLALSKNIPGMQVHVGSFDSLSKEYQLKNLYYKEHPLNIGYFGIKEEREWIAEDIKGYYTSFFSFWKKVSPIIFKKQYHDDLR